MEIKWFLDTFTNILIETAKEQTFFSESQTSMSWLRTWTQQVIRAQKCTLYSSSLFTVYKQTHSHRVSSPRLYSPTCVAGVYLAYFLIGNHSYIPCSEPSRTVILLDVIYTTDPHHRCNPWAAPLYLIPPCAFYRHKERGIKRYNTTHWCFQTFMTEDSTDLEFHNKLRDPWWTPSFRRLRTRALRSGSQKWVW